MDYDFLLIFCTCPNDNKTAKILSNKIINKKLAACVNKIKDINSIYFWENKINEDKEELLLIKTTSKNFEQLKELILKEHPYDCPEIIAIPIIYGSKTYLNWLEKNCK